jgi:replicative DNA helicase
MTNNNILHLDGMTFDKINDESGKRVYNPSTSKFTTISEQANADQKWVDDIFDAAITSSMQSVPIKAAFYDFYDDAQNSLEETHEAIMQMLQEELQEEQAALQGFLSQEPMSVLNWAAEDFFNMGSLDTQMDLFKNETILTGGTEFDDAFDGFELGTLSVIGSSPGVGRSTLLMNLAQGFSEGDNSTMVISVERSLSQLERCFDLSNPHHINLDLNSLTSIEPLDLLSLIIERLETESKRIKAIIIDDFSLFRTSDQNEYSTLIQELKSIAEDFNVAILVAVPFSRNAHTDGGNLWRNYDTVLIDAVDEAYELKGSRHMVEIRNVKSRSTPHYSKSVYFDVHRKTFYANK